MENYNENIKSLILKIKDKIGKPVSNRVVMATIESLGIRDKDTQYDFGVPSISYLADVIFKELTFSPAHRGAKNKKEREHNIKSTKSLQISDYLWIKAKIFAHYYPLGIFHLMPVFLQIASIILFGYSLWTFVGFNHVQSTAVVLGVIIGLVGTGGFVQVIGRQASFYWNYEDYVMTKQTVNYLLKTGMLFLLLLLGLIMTANFFFHVYPFKVLLIVFTYALLIGVLLLLLAPLHTIKQRWVISLAVSVGTVTAVLLKTQTEMMIYFTHWIGILIAIGITRVYLILFFRKMLKKEKCNFHIEMKSTVVLYHNYKYFFYGLFLYLFIFTDRILAWSSTMNGPLPFVVYFEKNYELGMDLGILVFLLLSGVLEYGVASFSQFLDLGQKSTSYNSPEVFNKQLSKMYWQHVILLLVTTVAIFMLIYALINAPWGYRGHFNEALDIVSINVSLIGGLGYMFLAWGMLNTLYLFTLGQPAHPLKAIIFAALLNLIVGLICSRFISYEYSVIGMLSGSVLFMLLTLKANIDFFKKLDYYYYAAY
ncbi:hypothetical protein [Flavobacterium sp. GT3R68]|uniref:hypothetical protein n=1 Tax=Flavobacterium sp. GT3R68 TaxID=2594437 RepID=UPI000F86C3B8|nr:hypothetical protein [Flavobacterium sp. GT3R68]RTY93667.1 hypothetical protein EKL32_15185 [Flavobacterium sp. GSN2]TRW91612.1 hypothetical protein FNW07_06900 [Flavobacterium sp. GT3R68]